MAIVRMKQAKSGVSLSAKEILEALIVRSHDVIWATELALLSGGRRVDFWTLMPSFSNGYRATAYEIKVSRADFKRDDDAKQEGARRWSDRFWYVTTPALLRKEEIPDWAGLQEWDGERFSVVKKPPMLAKAEPSWELVCSILRNSGDARRDIGLMRSQIAYYEQHLEGQQRIRKSVEHMNWQKVMRRHKASTRLHPVTD